MITIEDIFKELDIEDTEYNVLRIIYLYYLTEREQEYYHAVLLRYSGKPQKEIAILLNLLQPYFSNATSLLMRKLKRLARLFMYDSEKLCDFLSCIREKLTHKQYTILTFILGGNRDIAISRYMKCSPAHICKAKKRIYASLTKHDAHQLEKYIDILRG